MSPALGIFIMMNNYFHDVATALLLASGVALWIIDRKLDATNQGAVDYFLGIYRSMTRLARFSLWWILIGGIPRVLAYRDFEWANAAGKGQVPALIVKHVLAFAFVSAGAHVWIRINRRVKNLKERSCGIAACGEK